MGSHTLYSQPYFEPCPGFTPWSSQSALQPSGHPKKVPMLLLGSSIDRINVVDAGRREQQIGKGSIIAPGACKFVQRF